ncbi:MAG: methionyl-tRNA formyltransferase [Bacteroidales bacterium]|nr:methionyl-tRNA formyltransferase [Bacteroidales bacterium]
MKKVDKFLIKSFIGPFIAILLVVVFILMMQFLWLYIDELVGRGLGLSVILEFLFWGVCSQALPLALPLSTLLASMMTLGQMGENSELIAMKASGISLVRLMAPLMICSAVISVLAFFTVNDLSPYATNQIYTLRDDIGKTKSEIKIPEGTFYDGIEGYILRIGDRNEKTGMMYKVMVYDHTRNRGNTSVTIADSGVMKMSKAKDYLTFNLFNGYNYQETNTKKYRDTTLALRKIHFSAQEMIIPLSNYAFQKSDSARFSDQVRSMDMAHLIMGRDSLQKLSDEALERHKEDFRRQSSLTHTSQLDTSWRTFPALADVPHPLNWKNTQLQRNIYETAASNARQMESTLTNYEVESFEYNYILRRTNVEIWKKYAQALACLILFFIGAPLGALIRKGGLGTSAIVSVLFFVLYWVIDISGTKLARDGAASPFFGTFISAMILLPIGLFLTWKAIHDSTLFSADGMKTAWRVVKSKIMSLFKKTRIVYMGTPEFAVAPLQALLGRGYKVVGVVTVPDKPSGRGLKMNESAVKKFAVEHELPVLQPEKLKDPAFLEALAAWKADLFVVVGFRMLPEAVWSMPKLGTFNLHAALLPQYRGAAPINWAVINGESLTGVTTFMIDSKIDTGGIILRQEHRIGPADTAGDVHDALMGIGSELVLQTVEGLIQGNVETRVQRSFIQGSELLHPAPKLTRELCHIDWNDTTKNIYNLVRGLSPYPTAYTELAVAEADAAPVQLKVFFGEPLEESLLPTPRPAPGTVLSDGKNYLAVATADGALSLKDIQLAGKKRMDVKSFLLGFRNPEQYRATQGTSMAEIARYKPVEE